MLNKRMKYLIMALLTLSSMLLTGCIPANEHVGKPAASNYKDSYYGGYYSNGRYYYR